MKTITPSSPPGAIPAREALKSTSQKPTKRDSPSGAASKRRMVWKLVAIASVILLWHLVAVTPISSPGSVPTPFGVVNAFFSLLGESRYWEALGATLTSWGIGLAICAVVGIPAGLLIGVSRRATQSTSWIIDFLRTIPTVALLPLLLLLFGPTLRMELSMIVLSALWPIIIQSMYAAKQVEPLLKWVFRVFRVSKFNTVRYLWAPSVSLFVSTGMRLGAITALLVTITAEYIGGSPGLGRELSLMEETLRRPEVFAYAITAGIIGLMMNMALMYLQRRTLWWHPSIRGEG